MATPPGYDTPYTCTREAGVTFQLHRYRRNAGQKNAVVMLHGGNTSSATFLHPRRGLAGYLADNDWDVWLAEWRGSPAILDPILRAAPVEDDVVEERRQFALDTTADEELPQALMWLREALGEDRHLAVLAHCLSGCATSMSLARGHLAEANVGAYVLSTLGLFFTPTWDTWMKAEDFLVERIPSQSPGFRAVDPHDPKGWAQPLFEAFQAWPRAWLPPPRPDDILEPLTFMFGYPYTRDSLERSLLLAPDTLNRIFGPVHFGLAQHVAEMVRRGHSAPLGHDIESMADLRVEGFRSQKVTLVTGAQNRLWHRESVDLMYEWLRSNVGEGAFEKVVLPGFGHQDLFWGAQAHAQSYPVFQEALRA